MIYLSHNHIIIPASYLIKSEYFIIAKQISNRHHISKPCTNNTNSMKGVIIKQPAHRSHMKGWQLPECPKGRSWGKQNFWRPKPSFGPIYKTNKNYKIHHIIPMSLYTSSTLIYFGIPTSNVYIYISIYNEVKSILRF